MALHLHGFCKKKQDRGDPDAAVTEEPADAGRWHCWHWQLVVIIPGAEAGYLHSS